MNNENKISLTMDEMWKLTNNQIDIGIEGYVCPNINLIPKKIKPVLIKTDEETGKPIQPKRPNFLDEVFKWANSYYDKEKAEKVIEDLESKGRSLESKPKKDEQVPIKYADRKYFTDLLIREEKRKYEYLEDKLDIINAIKEKTKEWESKQLPFLEAMKIKYFGKNDDGKSKESLPKATRVTVVADAEYVGEKYPFYNTYKDPDGDDEKNIKLFFPSKEPTWKKTPVWSFKKHQKKEEEIEKETSRKEQEKEKYDSVLSAVKDKQRLENMDVQVVKAYNVVKSRGNIHFSYMQRKKKEEHQAVWDNYIEQNPRKYVGPQHYWKYPKMGFKVKKGFRLPEEDEKGNKAYYMNREMTDKRVYKPMKKHVF
jgi:hypothetical protein